MSNDASKPFAMKPLKTLIFAAVSGPVINLEVVAISIDDKWEESTTTLLGRTTRVQVG